MSCSSLKNNLRNIFLVWICLVQNFQGFAGIWEYKTATAEKCQVFYLKVNKNMTLNFSSFVYYNWKRFFFTEHIEICWGIDWSFKNKYRPMA